MANEFSVKIDASRLDVEWLRQPEMYHAQAVKLADARRELDETKNRAAVLAAEREEVIRLHPERFGIDKVTESAVKAALARDEKNIDAQAEIVEASHTVAIFAACVAALDHRKRALENLVELHLAGYFATPRKPASTMSEAAKTAVRRRGGKIDREEEDGERS